jgi:hypothetical protein
MGELKIINNSKNVIICFSGIGKQFGQIQPFEFLNHLTKTYENNVDLYFFIDNYQCWYHKGFNDDHVTSIDNTVEYLNTIIKNGNYEKIIFMGTSAGGYASILFGSLCNVTNVIAFIPQTILREKHCMDSKYQNLNKFINKTTKYVLYGDATVTGVGEYHHVSHCLNIKNNPNVKVKIQKQPIVMKELRDKGIIKMEIDKILN